MAQGDEVVIFTARVHPSKGEDALLSEMAIKEWCLKVFGRELEVTCMKDPRMKCIYDDRAVSVSPNSGMIMTVGYVYPRKNMVDSFGEFLEK